ncbi:kallikrein-14-like [Cimex lectularius]|uniref:Peptidase S1 domain-containing protein n=1 Tax=Cimex lectularius TaxID=79782 RepID=A0A8I6RK83_CIMLE|nr:kallikrein-14-like [Cimex lectularius]
MVVYNLGVTHFLIFVQALLLTKAEFIPVQKAPFQVQVELKSGSTFLAHAAILNCKWVVTVANAVNDFKPKDVQVRSGSGQLGMHGGLHSVRHIVVHGNYTKKNQFLNNIALIQIFYNFRLSKTVCPILLSETVPKSYSEGQVSGWWANKQGGQLELYESINIVPLDKCLQQYKEKNEIINVDAPVLCSTPVKEVPVSLGLSLSMNTNLQGLLIKQIPGLPFVYTAMDRYVSWVKDTLSKMTYYNSGSNKEQCEGFHSNCVLQLFHR